MNVTIMLLLFFSPVWVPVVLSIIVLIFKIPGKYSSSINSTCPKVSEGTDYKKHEDPVIPNKSIAEKIDLRMTNVFRNPWENIL